MLSLLHEQLNRIPLVNSTVRSRLCHSSFDSNVKYESNNITASSRQYHAGILIFGSTRSEAKWGGVGGGLIVIIYLNTCLKALGLPVSTVKACFVVQKTFISFS